jgi:predicted esterase
MRFLLMLLASLPALAEVPKAKSIRKEQGRDTVTLETGEVARAWAPAPRPGRKPGLVVSLHGMGDAPDTMLDWAGDVAAHRRDVWCAVQGGERVGSGWGWDPAKDVERVARMTRFAIAHYGADPRRVVVQGFSAGGLTAMYAATKNKDLFAGWISCASRGYPGAPGTDPKGLRAILILGDRDNVFQSVAEIRKGISGAGRGFSMWVVRGIGHVLPDPVYLNDALNSVLDPRVADGELELPAKADHGLAPPAGSGFRHVWIPLKSEGETLTRLQAKTRAEERLVALKSGDAAGAGPIGVEGLSAFGKKASDRAKAAKPGAWEIVETDEGFLLFARDAD